MDRITPTLAERIAARRRELGLRQEDLASAAGVSTAAVSQWEKGHTKNLRLEHLFVIADKLKVQPRWLALGQGAKYAALFLAALFVLPPSPAEAAPPGVYYVKSILRRLTAVMLSTFHRIFLREALPASN